MMFSTCGCGAAPPATYWRNLLALWQLHFGGSDIYEAWATGRVAGVWKAPVRIGTESSSVDEMARSMNLSGTPMAV